MQYIVCSEPRRFSLQEKPFPERRPELALLKVRQVGICGTDLHAYAGNQPYFTYPRILGHELTVEVCEIPDNKAGLKPGDRAIVMPYLHCGQCHACRQGKTNCCTRLQVLGVHTDGGMQEYIQLPIQALLPAEGLPDDAIAITEPLAIGAHAVRRAAVRSGDWVVVVGCGPIGAGLIAAAQHAGAQVIAIDITATRLSFAEQALGVEHVVIADQDALEKVRDLTGGNMAQAVFDATGHKTAMETGVQYVSHGGSYVLVGLFKGILSFEHPFIHSREMSILCSRNATTADFMQVKQMLQDGKFPTTDYLTHRVPFAEMIQHFDHWLLPDAGVMKAMVMW